MLKLDSYVNKLYGVGPKVSGLMARLQIETIKDLLLYFPFRYDDYSKITAIRDVQIGDRFAIRGAIKQIKTTRSFVKRMFITSAILEDKTGAMRVVWFNQPFLTKILRQGTEVILVGKIDSDRNGFYLSAPGYERVSREQIHTGRIVPVYPETRGLSSKFLRSKIKPVLELASKIQDFLPAEIKINYQLIDISRAVQSIHFPKDHTELSAAQRRLSFDELFLLQIKMLIAKAEWQSQAAPQMKLDKELLRGFVGKLPFKLTNAQRRAAWEIIRDITLIRQKAKDKKQKKIPPMNRLLEGDVGSGKTIVAAMAMLATAKAGYQSILMAPTEILAFQHYLTLNKLFRVSLIANRNEVSFRATGEESPQEPAGDLRHISIGLLTNSKSELNQKTVKRVELIKKIQKGDIQIVIGTHALITDKMSFDKLGLAVIDEQHRFGVHQRAQLRKKSHTVPHILSMTATPIPRTLSLALYGDLDVSIIDEMPPGRQKIETRIIHPRDRERAYQFVRAQVKAGRQAFVICPLIEESDFLGVKSVKTEYNKLSKEIFPDLRMAMLHGRMKGKEKEKVMSDFAAGKYDILVSTSVVEVGVDIPNATVMMIEGSERFGLAQLHQFRGRVGRGKHQSFCLLFTEIPSPKILARLRALTQTNDGFALAEKDLQFRGPGEIYGARQSGIADLKMARLSNVRLLKDARQAAENIISSGLRKYPQLSERLKSFETEKRLE